MDTVDGVCVTSGFHHPLEALTAVYRLDGCGPFLLLHGV
jgi:hypothetical protein